MLRKSRFLYTSVLTCLFAVHVASCTTARVPPDTRIPEARMRAVRNHIAFTRDSIPILRFDPPLFYVWVRARIEECSGRTREWPRLYVAPVNPLWYDELNRPVRAVTYPDGGGIVFALGEERNPGIVAHELIHWVYWPKDATHAHPTHVFGPTAPCASYLTEG